MLCFEIQKQKQLFASGDKFSRIFEECEREIRYKIRNTSPTTCHFSLRVQRLLVLLDSQHDTDLEQKLHFIVRDHVRKGGKIYFYFFLSKIGNFLIIYSPI